MHKRHKWADALGSSHRSLPRGSTSREAAICLVESSSAQLLDCCHRCLLGCVVAIAELRHQGRHSTSFDERQQLFGLVGEFAQDADGRTADGLLRRRGQRHERRRCPCRAHCRLSIRALDKRSQQARSVPPGARALNAEQADDLVDALKHGSAPIVASNKTVECRTCRVNHNVGASILEAPLEDVDAARGDDGVRACALQHEQGGEGMDRSGLLLCIRQLDDGRDDFGTNGRLCAALERACIRQTAQR